MERYMSVPADSSEAPHSHSFPCWPQNTIMHWCLQNGQIYVLHCFRHQAFSSKEIHWLKLILWIVLLYMCNLAGYQIRQRVCPKAAFWKVVLVWYEWERPFGLQFEGKNEQGSSETKETFLSWWHYSATRKRRQRYWLSLETWKVLTV